MKGVHVEWKVEKSSLEIRCGAIGVAVERHDGIDEISYSLVAGVVDESTILMDIDVLNVLAI